MGPQSTDGNGTIPPGSSRLAVSRREAYEKLSQQIRQGEAILAMPLNTQSELDAARQQRQLWDEYNLELLQYLFQDAALHEEYLQKRKSRSIPINLLIDCQRFHQKSQSLVLFLTSLRQRLDLMNEPPEPGTAIATPPRPGDSETMPPNIFIVHGHDQAAKEKAARFVTQAGFRPLILAEQSNQGKTLIEKLEYYADKAAFALVLLTGDDMGYVNGHAEAVRPRARQNVLLELGYFLAKLGRERVCALYQPGVEIPSDYSGVVWTPMDKHEAWKTKVLQEFRDVGFSFDWEKALS